MKASRIRIALILAVCGIVVPVALPELSVAREGYWQGDISNNWNTAGNWFVVDAPGDGGFVPQSSGGFNVRAIIGTDNMNGALNSSAAPFGSPVISGALLPTAKATIGGLYLGLRELNYSVTPPTFVNPAPAAGALVGSLTINAGTLNNVSTADSAKGADGRIVVGADGRGYLTMNGGVLTGQNLVVGGEDISTGNGTSRVDLRGSSSLSISTATPSSGTATFNRRLRIEGPSVNFSTSGSIRLNSSNTYTAVITSPTAHSPLKTAIAYVGGALNVEFSGAGATHSLNTTWDLIDVSLGMIGNFNNLSAGGDVNVTGLATPTPLGAAYRLKQVAAPMNHKLLQLSYEGILVLHVNRGTGELSVTNPLGGAIDLDGYSVKSTLGSLKDTYKGISGAPAGNAGWTKHGLSANALSEVKQTGVLDMSPISSISLGTGFDKHAVAAKIANFGTDGEDLIFEYTSPFGGVVRGQIQYEGAKFENNLVLRVNPNTGQATIKNDSLETLTFDGFSILSSTAALNGAGFSGLGGSWESSPATSTALTQTNLTGATTLVPGAELAIGDISSANFATADAQAGLSMEFILVNGGFAGDYNENGVVDAADYTVWRDKLGSATALPNDNTAGVGQDDYDRWKASFGEGTAFREGSVVFDATLGAGGGGLAGAAVPEPTTAWLLLAGIGSILAIRRGKQQRQTPHSRLCGPIFGQAGETIMSRQFGFCLLAAFGVCAALIAALPAAAMTQGIALSNFDFELPGPPEEKVLAFNDAGEPIAGIIPGWTFVGPGVETFGHDTIMGDSGTEGSGNPGNELLLSTFDGVVYQTATGFNVTSIPATQTYKFGFDAKEIFTQNAEGTRLKESGQLTVRYYYGAGRTTLATQVVHPTGIYSHYELLIPSGSALLTPAMGQPIGVEFDTTSLEFDAEVAHGWIGVDNVVMEITGALPGDLNGDGAVNTADYAIVRNNQRLASPFEFQGELTGDNMVNLNDFRAFKNVVSTLGAGSGSLTIGEVPEPSSLTLVLIVVGGASGVFRRKRYARVHCNRVCLLAMFGLVACFAAASRSDATLLAYDPFYKTGDNGGVGEYTASSPGDPNAMPPVAPVFVPISGQNPNTGSFFGGPWAAPASGDAPNGAVVQGGLSYLGTPAAGGAAGIMTPRPFTGDTNARYSRPLATPWDSSTEGTYYISYAVNFGAMAPDNLLGSMGYRGVEFTNLYVGYNEYYYPAGPDQANQKKPDTARMTFQVGPTNNNIYQIISNSPSSFNEDGATHLVVLKFEMTTDPIVDGSGGDTLSIFLDPLSTTEPDLPGASVTGRDYALSNIGFGYYGGDGSTSPIWDEIRIGTTFLDVLPELPTPGDTDGDHDVDLDDYATIMSFFNQQVAGGPAMGDVALANGTQGSDGRVGLGDFRLWKDVYPFPGAGSAAGVVPEPASLLLLSIAMLTLTGYGRRRR